MSEYEKPRLLHLEYCPAVCARAKWYQDPMFPDLGQHNCPHHFGVDYFAAIQDGVVHCKHLKPKFCPECGKRVVDDE